MFLFFPVPYGFPPPPAFLLYFFSPVLVSSACNLETKRFLRACHVGKVLTPVRGCTVTRRQMGRLWFFSFQQLSDARSHLLKKSGEFWAEAKLAEHRRRAALRSDSVPLSLSSAASFLSFSLLFWSLFFTLLFFFIGNRESGSQAGPEQICDAGRGRGGRSVASLRFSSGVRRRVLRDMATVLPPSAGGQRSLAAAARLSGPKGGSDYRCAGEFPLRALAFLRSDS